VIRSIAKLFSNLKFMKKSILILFVLIGFFSSCTDDEDGVLTPKPKAYMRIDFPKKNYYSYDSTCPFKFQLPVYSKVSFESNSNHEPCWFNINYLPFNAQLHISYRNVENNLQKLIEDSRELAIKHQIKASGLEQTRIVFDSTKVYGLIYDIEGNTASSMQFYVTDSSNHFLRGSLYFNVAPNIDSLNIVVNFLKIDVHLLIKTLKWK
jgi:gliding motility-associated lipoprotein GldD